MKFELKNFQKNIIESSWENIKNKGSFNFQAPTGSGKTLVTAGIIDKFIKETIAIDNYFFIHLSPSIGQLHEQNFQSFEKYKINSIFKNYNTFLFEKVLPKNKFEKNRIYFFGLDSLTKTNNKITKVNENSNFWDLINSTFKKNTKLVIIIDEQHIGFKGDDVTLKFVEKINKIHLDFFNHEPIYIRASATFDTTQGLNIDHFTTYQDVKDEEIVKKNIIPNKFHSSISEINKIDYLIFNAIKTREKISEEYLKNPKIQNAKEPLIIIQLQSGKDATKLNQILESIKKFENGKLIKNTAIWLSDNNSKKMVAGKRKISKYDLENDSDIKIILFKQAIATGWDVPRACVWVKFRKNMKESFEAQTLGRVLRNQFLKYHNNEWIDNAFLYTDHEDAEIKITNSFGNSELVVKNEKNITIKNSIKKTKYKELDSLFLRKYLDEEINMDENFEKIIKKFEIHKKLLDSAKNEIFKNIDKLKEWKWDITEGDKIDIGKIQNGKRLNFLNIRNTKSFDYSLLKRRILFKNKIDKLSSSGPNSLLLLVIDHFIKKWSLSVDDENFTKSAYHFFYENVGIASELILTVKKEIWNLNQSLNHSIEKYIISDSININSSFIDENLSNHSEQINNYFFLAELNKNNNILFQSNVETVFFEDVNYKNTLKIKLDSEIEYYYYNGRNENIFYHIEYINNDGKLCKYFPDFIISTKESIYILDTKEFKDGKVKGSEGSFEKFGHVLDFLNDKKNNGKKNIKFSFIYKEDDIWKCAYDISNDKKDYKTKLLSEL